MRTPTGNRCDDNERAPRVRRSLEVRAESVLLAPRRGRRTACERAQETAEDAAVRIGSDREMYAVEMDHQAEQVQVERPEDEIQDRADLARSLLDCLGDLDAELRDSLLIKPLVTGGARHLRRRPPELRCGCVLATRNRAEE